MESIPSKTIIFQFEELEDADLIVGAVYKGGNTSSLADEPIAKLLQVSNVGGIRYKQNPDGTYCYIVLLSSMKDSEWADTIDTNTGLFVYYGDNRIPGRALLETARGGNRILKDIFEKSKDSDMRKEVPPILVFTRNSESSDVTFRGLAVPGHPDHNPNEHLIIIERQQGSQIFQNYQARLTILNNTVISRDFIKALVENKDSGEYTPNGLKKWTDTGVYEIQSQSQVSSQSSTISAKEILYILSNGETDTVEFKRKITRLLPKDMVALANSRRDVPTSLLLLGVRDDGTIEGVHGNRETIKKRVENMAKSACIPPVPIRANYAHIGSLAVLVIEVLKNKKQVHSTLGSVYFRQRTRTRLATKDETSILRKELEKIETDREQSAIELRIDVEKSIRIKKSLETIENVGTIYSHIFLNILAVRCKNYLVALHADLILTQGQDLSHDVARYDTENFLVIQESATIPGIRLIIDNLDSGFITTSRGPVYLYNPEMQSANQFVLQWSETTFTPLVNRIFQSDTEDFGLAFTINGQDINELFTQSQINIEDAIKSKEGQHFDNLNEFGEQLIGQGLSTTTTSSINLVLPFWTKITSINQGQSELSVTCETLAELEKRIGIFAKYERRTPGSNEEPFDLKERTEIDSSFVELHFSQEYPDYLELPNKIECIIRETLLNLEIGKKETTLTPDRSGWSEFKTNFPQDFVQGLLVDELGQPDDGPTIELTRFIEDLDWPPNSIGYRWYIHNLNVVVTKGPLKSTKVFYRTTSGDKSNVMTSVKKKVQGKKPMWFLRLLMQSNHDPEKLKKKDRWFLLIGVVFSIISGIITTITRLTPNLEYLSWYFGIFATLPLLLITLVYQVGRARDAIDIRLYSRILFKKYFVQFIPCIVIFAILLDNLISLLTVELFTAIFLGLAIFYNLGLSSLLFGRHTHDNQLLWINIRSHDPSLKIRIEAVFGHITKIIDNIYLVGSSIVLAFISYTKGFVNFSIIAFLLTIGIMFIVVYRISKQNQGIIEFLKLFGTVSVTVNNQIVTFPLDVYKDS